MTWLWLVPALLLVLVSLPIELAFEVASQPRWRGSARLSWAWVFVMNIPLERGGARPEPARERSGKAATRVTQKAAFSALVPGLGLVMELLRRLLAATTVRDLTVHWRAGLDDPADTGLLCGALAPLAAWLSTRERHSHRFEPDFTRLCLELAAAVRVRVVPARWLLVLTGLLVKPRTWRAVYLATR